VSLLVGEFFDAVLQLQTNCPGCKGGDQENAPKRVFIGDGPELEPRAEESGENCTFCIRLVPLPGRFTASAHRGIYLIHSPREVSMEPLRTQRALEREY